jgi:hypothetical protein
VLSQAGTAHCAAAASATAVSLKHLTLSYLHTALADKLDCAVGIAAAAAALSRQAELYQQPTARVLTNCCARSHTAVAQVTIYCALPLCTGAPLAGSAGKLFVKWCVAGERRYHSRAAVAFSSGAEDDTAFVPTTRQQRMFCMSAAATTRAFSMHWPTKAVFV